MHQYSMKFSSIWKQNYSEVCLLICRTKPMALAQVGRVENEFHTAKDKGRPRSVGCLRIIIVWIMFSFGVDAEFQNCG